MIWFYVLFNPSLSLVSSLVNPARSRMHVDAVARGMAGQWCHIIRKTVAQTRKDGAQVNFFLFVSKKHVYLQLVYWHFADRLIVLKNRALRCI